MKPREFWIDEINERIYLEGRDFNTSDGLDFLKAHGYVTHVREVVKIDWEKVWAKVDNEGLVVDLKSKNSLRKLWRGTE